MTDLRASDADRERTVAALRHHAAAGRLTIDELDERSERAYAATTVRELGALQADLPAEVLRPPERPINRRRPRVPGTRGFTSRWHAPTDVKTTMAELMAHVAPPLERWEYDLVQRFDDRLRFEREVRPGWTILVAVFAFPIGLLGLVKTLALEGADQGVTATAVCPGYVRTPLVEKQVAAQAQAHGVPEDQALEEIILAPHAVKQLIEPNEVADVVAFLLGPTGRTFTGAAVTMDQGWTAM